MTDPNGQPKVSLNVREYVDLAVKHERELAVERERFLAEKFLTIEESRRLAKVEQDRRLESMNEFRAQLVMQANTFVTREFLDSNIGAVRAEMRPLLKSADRGEGVSGVRNWLAPSGTAVAAGFLGLAGFVIAVIALIFK